MRLTLPIICVITFCIVSVVVVDAVVPLGFVIGALLSNNTTPFPVRVLLLVPFAGTLCSPFVKGTLIRSILVSVSTFLLAGLWVFGLIAFVVYPMPDTRVSKTLPALTSIPFLLAVIATLTESIGKLLSARRLKRIAHVTN